MLSGCLASQNPTCAAAAKRALLLCLTYDCKVLGSAQPPLAALQPPPGSTIAYLVRLCPRERQLDKVAAHLHMAALQHYDVIQPTAGREQCCGDR